MQESILDDIYSLYLEACGQEVLETWRPSSSPSQYLLDLWVLLCLSCSALLVSVQTLVPCLPWLVQHSLGRFLEVEHSSRAERKIWAANWFKWYNRELTLELCLAPAQASKLTTKNWFIFLGSVVLFLIHTNIKPSITFEKTPFNISDYLVKSQNSKQIFIQLKFCSMGIMIWINPNQPDNYTSL